ncbi:LysR family transcriptional regulator [Sphingomonas solaris]|uniref:LysR family transcriptional regulator n=1 Tax=Alterirhizorhabdus solaris TaxID=2529389 RepID=A0A558R6H4_9SPHN|nr:LysR family transcriptional regulator [Sphingomonas solaris]TVV74985.1 LysR family transcriptional regulator [Sphingomonas solaris]
MMDRYLLRYFLAVIDAGNFSRAAAQCNVSQPTLSVGIAKLERQAGQPLFHRTNRRVELTAAGARFATHARRIEAEFALAEHVVREAVPRTTLRLGVLVTIPAGWIETFVTRLGDTPGRLPIEIVEGRERDLIEQLSRGRIDVALTLVRAESDRFAAEPLFEEGYALALPASHPLAGRHTIAAGELADNVMIVRRQCELLSDTSRHFTARGVRPFFAARTLSDERAIGYVRSGLGVTVMPACFRDPGIVRPRLADFAFTRTIGLLYGAHVDRTALRGGATLTALADEVRAARRGG